MCAPYEDLAPAQNTPQGVEKEHEVCRIDIKSSDRG